MSPCITIRDVPEITHKRLVALAKKNHRSMRGQLLCILEQAVRDVPTFEPINPNEEKSDQ